MVWCLNNQIFVLSSNGRVFSSSIIEGSSELRLTAVPEIGGEEIVCLLGTYEHCLAVSNEGRFFSFGSNENGQLGLGRGTNSASSFTDILSLCE